MATRQSLNALCAPFAFAAVQSEMLVKGGQGDLLTQEDVLGLARRQVREGGEFSGGG